MKPFCVSAPETQVGVFVKQVSIPSLKLGKTKNEILGYVSKVMSFSCTYFYSPLLAGLFFIPIQE